MMPSVRRMRGKMRGVMLLTAKPFTMMRPEDGTTSPVSSLMRVDFPLPEGPTRNTNSPSWISNEMPRMAAVPFSYSISTSLRRIISPSAPSRNRPRPGHPHGGVDIIQMIVPL